ncbi:TM2 domain-containing protein [uncultured Sphingomonas sp.]|uniref:TM2 domain-containing protein n=1 Tax=uncultured Sphingomonas sp. TaxID=158754 RepID=UPI0035CB0B48
MKGQILGVDVRTGDGQLTGEDGRRYRFRPDDWAHRGEPAVGLQVDFEPESDQARSIFPVPVAGPSPALATAPLRREPIADRSRLVAALLAFFLGMLGIHRFYLGRTASALVMLVLTLSVAGSLVTLPWAILDCLRYLFMSDREFARRYGRD